MYLFLCVIYFSWIGFSSYLILCKCWMALQGFAYLWWQAWRIVAAKGDWERNLEDNEQCGMYVFLNSMTNVCLSSGSSGVGKWTCWWCPFGVNPILLWGKLPVPTKWLHPFGQAPRQLWELVTIPYDFASCFLPKLDQAWGASTPSWPGKKSNLFHIISIFLCWLYYVAN